MQQLRLSFAGDGVSVLSIIFFLASISTTEAHNITRILAKFPDFSAFNHYLTLTHLAAEINSRRTITVLAVNNEGMEDLLSKHLQISFIKNVLSFHVLLDYFDARKLHQITGGTALAATVFQASGNAPGSSGFVKITDLRKGRVGFGAQETGGIIDAVFIKSLEEIAFNISVIQISKILPLASSEVPTPPPSPINITSLMSAHGCKEFAETLLSSSPAEKAYEDNLDGGVTIFCPGDDVFNKFLPIYKNLSADEQQSLLEYHGIPLYESLATLRSTNGVMNTLATDGVDKYGIVVQNDGEDITLKTNVVTAKITGTIIEKQSSVGIFMIDKVLLPMEIFNATTTISSPAPSPGPDVDVEKPKSPPPKGKRPKHLSPPAPDSDSPALSPDDDVADQTDDNNNSDAAVNGLSAGVPFCMLWVFLLL